VALAVLVWVAINQAVDSTCGDGGSENALSFLASPTAWFLPCAEGLGGSGGDGSFERLADLLVGFVASSARARTG
jgi:hypothetical protein